MQIGERPRSSQIANPPYMIGGLRMARPGMAATIVHQREDAWARELRFLDRHLARVGSALASNRPSRSSHE